MTGHLDRLYEKAEAFLPWNASADVLNASVKPFWLPSSDAFWYRSMLPGGHEFRLFDVTGKASRPAFDHAALARAMSVPGSQISAKALPFDEVQIDRQVGRVHFTWKGARWTFESAPGTLERVEAATGAGADNLSPDGRYAVGRIGNDLSLRVVGADAEVCALTSDGTDYFAYAKSPDSSTSAVTVRRAELPARAIAIWSPDSSRLFTYRLDERRVREMYLIQSALPDGAARPKLFSYRYPNVGDADVAEAHLCAFDVSGGTRVDAQCPPLFTPYMSAIELQLAWWGEDCRHVYIIALRRGEREASLLEFDTDTGAVRTVLMERATTFLDFNLEFLAKPNVRVLPTSREVVWFSQRDGWAHLYLYDLDSGKLKRQITTGPWVVRDILAVDPSSREMIVTGSGREAGRDPYFRAIYRISLDGLHDISLLTPEPIDHSVVQAVPPVPTVLNPSGVPSAASGISPCGKYFVDTMSSGDTVPRSVLRSTRDGSVLAAVERADMSRLISRGWRWPESFSVKSAAGTDDLYGSLFLPPGLDPEKKYPVVESIYPGPQIIWTAKAPFAAGRTFVADAYFHARALSELGFIVVTVDGPGTPLRSKAFHDQCFGNMQAAGGLGDHIHALRTLAATRPYMDLDRVGIYGHSGGGYAATRAMLDYPHFYRAGVASASNNDMRGYLPFWAEKYQGPAETADFDILNNCTRAACLEGALLMVMSDVDDNTSPGMTVRMAAALVSANKDFELLIMPNESHMSLIDNGYFVRRLWDFFVRRLLERAPPADYRIRDMRGTP